LVCVATDARAPVTAAAAAASAPATPALDASLAGDKSSPCFARSRVVDQPPFTASPPFSGHDRESSSLFFSAATSSQRAVDDLPPAGGLADDAVLDGETPPASDITRAPSRAVWCGGETAAECCVRWTLQPAEGLAV